MRKALLFLAAVVVLAGCGRGHLRLGPGEEGEIVESEGWTPLDEADPMGTKQRSLADAEKKAVEKVLGVYVAAKTRVDQAVAVDQRIMANVDGYIRRYEILGERKDEGFLKTKIRALVLYKKVGDDLKQLGLTRPAPPPGNPRMAVLLSAGPAAKGLRSSLVAAGFLVVDRDDPQGADLVVKGEADVHPVDDARLGGLHSARARAQVEASKPKTGEVLAHESREASALDAAQDLAAEKALESAGTQAGAALAKDLSSLLKSQIGIVVRVGGLKDLDTVRRIAEDIRINPGVDGVTLSDFHDGLAELKVTAEDMTGNDLAAILLRGKKFRLTASSVTAYLVELQAQ